jgi:hypothetical protein
MTRVNLAYRHDSGDVEGFSGWAFTGAGVARGDAVRRVRAKCEAAGLTFRPDRLVESPAGLTRAEVATVRADWELCG